MVPLAGMAGMSPVSVLVASLVPMLVPAAGLLVTAVYFGHGQTILDTVAVLARKVRGVEPGGGAVADAVVEKAATLVKAVEDKVGTPVKSVPRAGEKGAEAEAEA